MGDILSPLARGIPGMFAWNHDLHTERGKRGRMWGIEWGMTGKVK
jgi:hypothetical protein